MGTHPSRCPWSARFEQLAVTYPASGHPDPAVGAHWFLTLTDEDVAQCDYHRADWERIAAVSVEVLIALGENVTLEGALEAIEKELGNTVEGRWCLSLFDDPIVCRPSGRSVTNGQHRACALRASKASFCVVDVGDAHIQKPRRADPRRRAAAALASFWARQAAS